MRVIALALAGALALSGCATVGKLDAASDVHTLLISIRDDDRATFEAHVDRPALQRDIQGRISERTGRIGNETTRALAALLAPAVARVAGDILVQPHVFRAVAEHYGYRAGMKIPPPIGIARVLKPLPDGRVCATRGKDGPCVLMFGKADGIWKLTGFQGDTSELRL